NANPLMRFDGYYILADLLEIPNLASDGNRCVQQLSRRVFFGEATSEPQTLGARGWLTRIYGCAALAWRLGICISLIATASVMWQGAGVALALFGAATWFGKPL